MKSLIFQSWGIRAIQDGTKTMTRRIIKPQPEYPFQFFGKNSIGHVYYFGESRELCRLENELRNISYLVDKNKYQFKKLVEEQTSLKRQRGVLQGLIRSIKEDK